MPLNGHGLKGFEFEALRAASYGDEDLWRAVAAAAKHRRAILAAYQTGKGEWIATIQAFHSDAPIAERRQQQPLRDALERSGVRSRPAIGAYWRKAD